MSYCRHENTERDLRQVAEKWDDYEQGSSSYEDKAREEIIEHCKSILECEGYEVSE
jgi:hypothetical protein